MIEKPDIPYQIYQYSFKESVFKNEVKYSGRGESIPYILRKLGVQIR